MSAYSIGTTAFAPQQRAAEVRTAVSARGGTDAEAAEAAETVLAPTRQDALSAIVKWVPGEVIGVFAVVLTADQATGSQTPNAPSNWILWGFVVAAALWTAIAAINAHLKFATSAGTATLKGRGLPVAVRAALASVGFFLWSFVIPGSPSSQWEIAADRPGTVAAVVFALAILFGLAAEALVLWLDLRQADSAP